MAFRQGVSAHFADWHWNARLRGQEQRAKQNHEQTKGLSAALRVNRFGGLQDQLA